MHMHYALRTMHYIYLGGDTCCVLCAMYQYCIYTYAPCAVRCVLYLGGDEGLGGAEVLGDAVKLKAHGVLLCGGGRACKKAAHHVVRGCSFRGLGERGPFPLRGEPVWPGKAPAPTRMPARKPRGQRQARIRVASGRGRHAAAVSPLGCEDVAGPRGKGV